jgi:hypothetical protein
MQNEKAVKAQVKRILQNHAGVTWWFMPPANGYGRSGVPDFVGCVQGQMFAVETKSGAGTLTANQMREIDAIMRAGARVWIVREVNLATFEVEFNAWVALCS